MARKFEKASSEYLTLDLTRKLALGNGYDYLPISFFVRYTWGATAAVEDGVVSWSNPVGTNTYWAIDISAAGIPRMWLRGTCGTVIEATAIGDIRGDGKWHGALASVRPRDDIDGTRLRFFVDGDKFASQDTANQGAYTAVDDYTSFGIGLGDYASTPGSWANVDVAEFAVWHDDLSIADSRALYYQRLSPLFIRPDRLISYVTFEADLDFDVVSGVQLAIGGGTPIKTASPPVIYPDGFNPRGRQVVNPMTLLHGGYHRKRLRQGKAAAGGPSTRRIKIDDAMIVVPG